MRQFNNFIEGCNLFDFLLANEKLMWVNSRARTRIDRCLFSKGWMDLFLSGRQVLGLRVTSYHWSIFFYFRSPKMGSLPFRFENRWLDHPSLKSSILAWWSVEVPRNWEGYWFTRKLRNLKDILKVWNMEVFGDIKIKKQELMGRIKAIDDLEEVDQLSPTLKDERLSLKAEFVEIVRKELVSWRQKAKVR